MSKTPEKQINYLFETLEVAVQDTLFYEYSSLSKRMEAIRTAVELWVMNHLSESEDLYILPIYVSSANQAWVRLDLTDIHVYLDPDDEANWVVQLGSFMYCPRFQ